MSHPQLCADLLGCPLPPQPGELGASDVAPVAGAMQPGDGHQATQACCIHFEHSPVPGVVYRNCDTHHLSVVAQASKGLVGMSVHRVVRPNEQGPDRPGVLWQVWAVVLLGSAAWGAFLWWVQQ